jgi:hypothetical protein
MKKLLLFILLFISVVANAQKGISYQAVVLDPTAIELPGQDITGQPLVNGNVSVKFVIVSGGSIQFEEVQQTKTDAYGLVNLTIGSVASTAFNALTWDANQKSLQVFVSFNNGASYTKVSDQKLSYSPYALFAETAGKLGSTLGIAGGGTGATTAVGARANLGLGNVDNTSDADKPISTATQAALDLKANAAEVNSALALKATVSALEAHMKITADTTMLATKAALTDLNNYAPINSPTFTGTVTSPQFVLIGGLPTQYLMADGSTSNVTAKNLFSTDINVNGLNIGKGRGAIETNTSIGLNVLSSNTSGYFNAGIGDNVLSKNTTGFENTALGHIAMLNNTTGSFNTAIGKESLARNTIGGSNTAIGVNSLVSNINGGTNIAIGNNSLFNNVSGNNNTGVGFGALVLNQTGSTLTAIGKDADVSVDGLTNAIAIGYNAKVGASNTIQLGNNSITSVKTNGVVTASGYIVSGGTSSQYLMADGSVSAGGSSTVNLATSVTGVLPVANGGTGSSTKNFVDLTTNQTIAGSKTFSSNINVNGLSIGRGNGNNDESVAIGPGAMGASNINGKRNTAVGAFALANYNGTYWDNITSIGYRNMPSLTTGSGNTSVGAESMLNLLTGSQNTSIGNQSLINVTGNNNVGVGKRSGQTITSGGQNTIIGTDADVTSANLSNASALGYGAQVSASNSIQLGNGSVSNVKTSGTITAGVVTYPNTNGNPGQVLTANANGTATWQSISTKTYDDWPFISAANLYQYSGYIIATQHGSMPDFPEDLPDGFTLTICNYSNFTWTSNVLTSTRFYTSSSGNGGVTSFSINPGAAVNVYVITTSGQKRYYIK